MLVKTNSKVGPLICDPTFLFHVPTPWFQARELTVMQKLRDAAKEMKNADPVNVLQLDRNFHRHNRICLVFNIDGLSMNLRELRKNYDTEGHVGLDMRAVRSYAQQLLSALGFLKKCSILHADIKPDNILVGFGWFGMGSGSWNEVFRV